MVKEVYKRKRKVKVNFTYKAFIILWVSGLIAKETWYCQVFYELVTSPSLVPREF
jgi:hypothetical protein